MARQHWVTRLGLVAGLAGGIFILGACSRPGGGAVPTATAAVTVRTTTAVARTPTRTTTTAPSISPSVGPTAAPTQTSAAPPPATATVTQAATGGQKYVVQSGDTLSDIADMFGVTVQELIDANKLENPNLLLPGQELVIPGH